MKNKLKLLLAGGCIALSIAACTGGNKGHEADSTSSTQDTSVNGGMSGDTTNNGMGGMSDTTTTTPGGGATDSGSRM